MCMGVPAIGDALRSSLMTSLYVFLRNFVSVDTFSVNDVFMICWVPRTWPLLESSSGFEAGVLLFGVLVPFYCHSGGKAASVLGSFLILSPGRCC